MGVMPGHSDLKSHDVIGFTADGKVLIDFGEDGAKQFCLKMSPTGGLRAEPIPVPENVVDQLGKTERATRARRLAGIDQA